MTPTSRLIDRWLPWMIVGVFVLLFIVLGQMVHMALSGFQGVVTEHAYEEGLAYNRQLDAKARQLRSGFVPSLSVAALAGTVVQVRYAVRTDAGAAIPIQQVSIRFIRPTAAGMDRHLVLRPAGDAAQGRIALPARGVWDVVAMTTVGGVPLQSIERIVL